MKRIYQHPSLFSVDFHSEDMVAMSPLFVEIDEEDNVDAGGIGVKSNPFEESIFKDNPFL